MIIIETPKFSKEEQAYYDSLFMESKDFEFIIEVDEEGNKLEWNPRLVWSREMKDNDCFILERSGRGANRPEGDSYWNRDPKDKYDINKYNIQFILDDVHPDSLALPCCGKKPISYPIKSVVNVLITRTQESGPYWETGQITGPIETKGPNKDKYPISINESKPEFFHISLLKPTKGSFNTLSYDCPLKQDQKGYVHPILKDLFHL